MHPSRRLLPLALLILVLARTATSRKLLYVPEMDTKGDLILGRVPQSSELDAASTSYPVLFSGLHNIQDFRINLAEGIVGIPRPDTLTQGGVDQLPEGMGDTASQS
jgi:hypothetical protein